MASFKVGDFEVLEFMLQIIVDKGLSVACPSILDLEPSMVDISPKETLEISWGNSKLEKTTIARYRDRNFVLYVPDLNASVRATAALELSVVLDTGLVDAARVALSHKKLYNWRDFSKTNGVTVSKNILLKMSADDIRKGNKSNLAFVVKDMFLNGVTPTNADTLLRLRILRRS